MPDTRGAPFEGREQQDVLRVFMADGRVLLGSYMSQAGMHFLHVRDGSLVGRVEGPLEPGEVGSVQVVRTRAEVLDERFERSRGDPLPGREPRTREEFEERLWAIARAAAAAGEHRRRGQLERQFDDVADRVALARAKRRWMLGTARWTRHSNEEPSLIALSGGDLTMAGRFRRPRPQDFDPDPAARRVRVPVPRHVAEDPISVPNMIRALRDAGFKARPALFGETDHDRADLLVDFAGGKMRGRFSVHGHRDGDGAMRWGRPSWSGGDTKTGLARMRRAERSAEYGELLATLAVGRVRRPRAAARRERAAAGD